MELTLDQALQKGVEAHKAGKVQEADQYYTAILKANPKHPEANYNMGVLAVGVGKVEAALPFFKTALEAKPSIAQFWVGYINALIKLDQMDVARDALEQAKTNGVKANGLEQIEEQLGSSPSKSSNVQEPSQDELNSLFKLYNQNRLQQVLNEAQKLQKRYTKSLSLWNLIGSSAAQLGQLDEAINAFQKAISIKPDYAKAYYNMGNALRDLGKLKQAVEAYKKALASKPDYAEAYNNMGYIFQQQEKPDEAIEAYNNAISIKPDYAEANYNMGNVLTEQGELDKAIEAYGKALSIMPDYAEAYSNMGNALQDQGKLDEAIEAYKKALAVKPDYAEAYYNLGNILKDQGKLEEAIETYNKALTIMPDYAEAYNNLGATLNHYNKPEKALETYQKALTVKPDYAQAFNNMGRALQDQDRLEEAVEAYNKAISIAPDYAEAYNNLGFVKLKTAEWEHGIKLREWRWKTIGFRAYKRFFEAPEWDGKSPLYGKTLLIWGEQGPGDIIIWCSCLNYYTSIGANLIVECPQKLVKLLTISFPKITVRVEKKDLTATEEDFDFQIPMETLFGHSCLSGKITDHQNEYIFPNEKRVKYWKSQLKLVTEKPCIGISWKSPVMSIERSNNYADLSFWKPLLQNNKYTFFNLQSSDFEDDLKTISQDFGVEVINFDDLDHYDDLADVAAFCKALDFSISVATTVAHISTAVGTHTIIPTWEQGPWNNIIFNSRGPKIDSFYRNTWESWENTFSSIAKMLS